MKKIIPLIVSMLFCVADMYAQDQIITKSRDTLDCKVIKIGKNQVSFVINTSGIKSYGKFPSSEVLNVSVSPSDGKQVKQNRQWSDSDRFVISLSGGLSYLLGSTKDAVKALESQGATNAEAKKYYNEMVLGNQIKASFRYFLNPGYGVGANYRFFNTQGRYNGTMDPKDGVHLYYGGIKENIYMNFYGLSLYTEHYTASDKIRLFSSAAFGLTDYRNEMSVLYIPSLITGQTFSMDMEIGFRYFIRPRISVGAAASVFVGKLKKVEYSIGNFKETIELDKDNRENLSAADLSVCFSFYF